MRGRRFFVEVPAAAGYYEPQREWLSTTPESWIGAAGRQYFSSKRLAIRQAEYLAEQFGEALAGYRAKDKNGKVVADRVWTITRIEGEASK